VTYPLPLRLAAITLVITAPACNPALNWREVRMENLTAMLPCKPDQAQRMVRLANQDLTLQMAGCEASGALYAISHARVVSPDQAMAVQADWRSVALANMQATSVQTQAIRLAKPVVGMSTAPPDTTNVSTDPALDMLEAQGRRPDGSAVQARLVWFTRGVDIYHVAAYGPQLDSEKVEMLFSDLRLQ